MATLLLQPLLVIGSLSSIESSNVVESSFKTPTPSPSPIVKCGLPKEELDQLVEEFNAHRLEVAEKEQIANMHEIRYDFELENQAKTMTECERKTTFQCDIVKNTAWKFGSPMSQNHPLHTGFAFCSIEVFEWGKNDNWSIWNARWGEKQYIYVKQDPYRLFLYGPSANRGVSAKKTGPPGSQCPNGTAVSGLCKAPWHIEATTLPSVPPTTPVEEIDKGGMISYSFCFIYLVVLLLLKL